MARKRGGGGSASNQGASKRGNSAEKPAMKQLTEKAKRCVSVDGVLKHMKIMNSELKDTSIVIRTVTVHPDGVLKVTKKDHGKLMREFNKYATSIGIGKFVVVLFLQWAANLGCCTRPLFEWRFHEHVCFKLFEPGRIKLTSDNQVKYPGAIDAISSFRSLLKLPLEVRSLVQKNISSRMLQCSFDKYLTVTGENIMGNFKSRCLRHIAARLEIKLGSFMTDSEFGARAKFLKRMVAIAEKVFLSCALPSDLEAKEALTKYFNTSARLQRFSDQILSVMHDVRILFTFAKSLYRVPFFWKYAIMREIRSLDNPIREARTRALSCIQMDLHNVRGEKDTADASYHGAMQPGFYSVHKESFTLMSSAKLQSEYIVLVADLLIPIVRRVMKHWPKWETRMWMRYDIGFNLHGCNVARRLSGCVTGRYKMWIQSTLCSVVELAQNIRCGIPLCAKTPGVLALHLRTF